LRASTRHLYALVHVGASLAVRYQLEAVTAFAVEAFLGVDAEVTATVVFYAGALV
jgi:hypothetical protein